MFTTILIANRGEIACRVAATARRMGIKSVAVYSEADAAAKHVEVCDRAVLIGPAPAAESYLRGDRIIEAALAAGAQAIHPGYGFLSENGDFAAACAAAGLVFIGPPPSAMRAMGSKAAAKARMEAAGVPLLPGYHGEQQDAAALQAHAAGIGYPVLLKPSAGGGGKGMRIVERAEDFGAALAACKREATAGFGDDRMLLEKYLPQARHIEIQVFADSTGECLSLFERDCSVQRRHQKVLEEAPAPGMTPERRKTMSDAAIAAAKAVGYVGAGTVEFIVSADNAFYFMEMNTRLQVEHAVTEMVTGIDLVEWQLRIACGEPLPRTQEQIAIHGHAIEARIYAENPEHGFLPSSGTLRYLRTPQALAFEAGAASGILSSPPSFSASVRIDSGVREGDAISPFYDPLIAKLIVWGSDREQARVRLAQALSEYRLVGLASNLRFLRRLVESSPFVCADLDTGLIERHRNELFPAGQPAPMPMPMLALAAAALLDTERDRFPASSDPWSDTSGWRINGASERALHFHDEDNAYALTLLYQAGGALLMRHGAAAARIIPVGHAGNDLTIRLDGATVSGSVVPVAGVFHVFMGDAHGVLIYDDPMARAGRTETEDGCLTAPMPGKILAVLVGKGGKVAKGAPLLIMEAMKMEHTIVAPGNGIIEEVKYAVGDQVAEGAQLLIFKTE
jgi:3-methylcrotonyl-CoA carboxylase alpha subunit